MHYVALIGKAHLRVASDSEFEATGIASDGIVAQLEVGEAAAAYVSASLFGGISTTTIQRFVGGVLAKLPEPPNAIGTMGGGKWTASSNAGWMLLPVSKVWKPDNKTQKTCAACASCCARCTWSKMLISEDLRFFLSMTWFWVWKMETPALLVRWRPIRARSRESLESRVGSGLRRSSFGRLGG